MYKVIIKYFGELCDKEQFEDEEVFDEEIICETEDLVVVRNEIENQINTFVDRNYVLDLQKDKNMIRLFFGVQENWNDYLEIYYVEDDIIQENFIDDLYVFGYIKTIKYKANENLKSLRNKVNDNGYKDNFILEMALMIELKHFLDNERYVREFAIDDIKLMSEFRGEFIDSVVSNYFNGELGTSYDDIHIMVVDFLNDYRLL